MPSLMNGLSAMGSGIASFAGTAGLEAQKADLAQQGMRLADQLAHTSKTAEIAQLQTGQEKITGMQTASQQAVADTGAAASRFSATTQAGATLGSAGIYAQGSKDVATIQANAMPPDVKEAIFLSTATPEQKAAYTSAQTARLGLPPWAMAPATDGGGGASSSPASGGVTGSPGNAAAPSTPAPNAQGRAVNEHALDNLPGPAAELVKRMVEGRISPPGSFAMSRPGSIWMPLLQKAMQYDPKFDEASWAARVATRKDFADGKAADAVTAINTALPHAANLANAFDKLNNQSVPALNAVGNYFSKQFGDPRVTNAQEAINALAAEARKVFSASGGGNLVELEEWQKNFDVNGSPAQQKGALTQFVDLLDSRMEALADRRNRGLDVSGDKMDLLRNDARAAYLKLTGQPAPSTGNPPPPLSPGAQPPPGQTQSASPSASLPAWATEAPAAGQAPKPSSQEKPGVLWAPLNPAARQTGTSYILPNGKTGVWAGSGWQVQP